MSETTADIVTGPGESASLEAMGYKQELKRALSFWDLIVFGLIDQYYVCLTRLRRCSATFTTTPTAWRPWSISSASSP